MKEMKRILSLVLVLVMLVGVLPATAFATETSTPVDAAIFGSDVHGATTSSSNGYYLSNVLAGAQASGLTYSAIGFVGDTALPIATVESTVNTALGYIPYLAFSYASAHDDENNSDLGDYWDWSGEVAANTGEAYSDNYYIYSIRQDDMTSSSNASTAAAAFTSWVETADTKKPVFIISHIPMHDARDDNNGASAWFDAIQAAGEKMDIVFFWAHNHTEESKGTTRDADQAAYYVAKDGDEVLDVYNGNDAVPNFTYMNAGYINANKQSNIGRLGRMTSVALYADNMVFQDYTTTGAVSDDYSHNVTIKYEFASLGETETVVTLESIAISGETEYTVGDELALTVTATYSDTTTKDVTAEATLSGYDMSAAGTYTVTAAYEDKTATYNITVAEAEEKAVSYMTISEGSGVAYVVGDEAILYKMYVAYTDGTKSYATQDDCTMVIYDANGTVVTEDEALSTAGEYSAEITYLGFTCGTKLTFTVHESGDSAYDLLNLIINGAEVTADVKNVTEDEAVVAAMATVEGIDDYVAYDITADLAEGASATVSIPVSADWAEGEFAVYYITDEGVISDETFEPTYADGYVTFTAAHFSTYTVTVTLPSGGEVETEGSTAVVPGTGSYTSTPVTVYKLVETPEVGKEYLIVHDNDGAGYGLNSNTSAYSTTALDTTGYYTTWNESTSTGTAVSADDVYATATSPFLWKVGGSAGAYTFTNGSYTLGATWEESGFLWWTSTDYSLNFTGTGGNTWAYSGNNLSTTYTYNGETETIYLSRSGATWSASGSGATSVYFYEPVELIKVTYEGTEGGTYTATGNDQLDITTSADKNITLTSTLTFTTDSGTTTTVSDLTDWTVTYEVMTDASDIVKSVSGSTAVLNNTAGSATLKVTYYNASIGTAWDEFVISTKLSGGTTVTGTSGMHVDKTVELQADGTYTINLEAFSTGASVKTETVSAKPTDIILVLDTSNSMSNSSGMSSSGTTKLSALKTAATTFVSNVHDVYDSTTANHRISIISYNGTGNTQVKQTWTEVNDAGETSLNTTINALTTAKGTKTGPAMKLAYQTGKAGFTTDGTRNNIVILFTDGDPTIADENEKSTSFNEQIANMAIYYGMLCKTEFNAKVYSIAVLDTADPTSTTYQTTPSEDQINFMLQAVSSNHPNATITKPTNEDTTATSTSTTSSTTGLNSYGNFSSTLDASILGSKASDKYYYKATSVDSLTAIFTTISSEVNSSSTTVELDSTSVMKDIIGAEFTVPADILTSDDIEIKVVTGSTTDGTNFTFGTENVTDISKDVTYTVTDSTSVSGGKDINITGFSYKDYYITANKQGDNADKQYKLIVTISGIKVADDVVTDEVFNTNGTGSGLYAKDATEATATFPQPKSVVTSKMYVLDYAKDVTLDEADWYAKTVNLADAYTTTSKYGAWSADGSALTYSPNTTMWGGFDTATVIGEINDAFKTQYSEAVHDDTGANVQYVLSKVSVIPANNVYYEDSFVTSEATGTVGIEFSDGWTVEGTDDGNTEVPEDDEDDTLGSVHGWIDSMDDDNTYSDGTAHVSSTVGSTATFSFTGTGVDVYSYTDMESGMVIGMLYEGEGVMDGDSYKVAQKTLMVDNLAVSGNYYQIPTLSFENLTYGTYTLRLYVSSAKAPVLNEDGTVKTEDVLDEDGNPTDEEAIVYSSTEKRSTYYLDGIRVYNPLGATTNAYTGTNQTTTFTEVRDIILESGALDITESGTTVNSAMFIDLSSDGTTAKLMGYEETEFAAYGPKNEVYLGAGQAIVFSVESAGDYYIGLKSPTGATTTAYLFGDKDYSVPFSHTTDQYYEITPDTDGNICIYNGGSTMLSITKIQMVSEQAAVLTLRSITSEQAVSYAVASVASIDEVEEIVPGETVPEETVPEETVPEETVPDETIPDIKVEIENKFNEAKNTLRGFVNKLFSSMSSWFGR